ncbi:sugar phosphate nucleotidyltransferase [Petroclostridium sp. X23]|uniref:sugar phosphate nucleotidyltransferase n=1 Tax=Petroclostridium sp. X23 TaxID=3045146 RepID=UPI0024ADB44F|nr:sugar phosphate nucleotidyltransferase [Petroclostridium sp. X23]WHH58874.1 sugar phosphate nucleotidyltransferase [Petroclostridium sp. X23]
MKAIIMAGGEGTRLRPLTCSRPKPMVPVMNKPVMEHIINLLKKHHITEIGVTLQYMPEIIQEYFGDGHDFGVNIRYFIEETPLGTAGSVKNAEEFLDDTFIVISGDALTDIDLEEAIRYHSEKKAVATLVLTRVNVPLEYGVVVTDGHGRITRFLEKPSWSEVFSDTVNTGIYILNPKVLNYFKSGEMFDFSKDLFPMLLKEGQPMYGHVSSKYWCDIGDLIAYHQCHFDILDGKVSIVNEAVQIRENVWAEENVEIGENANIAGPVLIGRNTKIKNGAIVSPYTVIGSDNVIAEQSSLKRAIVWKGCKIGKRTELRGCILCNKVLVKENSSVFEQSVIGDGTAIEERAVIKPGIKIWPAKTVESGTEINVNLIWGTKYSKTLFGEKGIVGEVNVDITPEFASRLGTSYGVLFKNNARVGISSDEASVSYMLKNSFVSGLLSSGVEVYDFGQQVLPVTRYATKFFGLDGGIHLGTISDNNDSKLIIDFLDMHGANINRGVERKLENTFIREDFSRCEAKDVKNVKLIDDFTSYYLRDLINRVENKKLNYRLLINNSSVLFENMIIPMISELGCKVDITNLQIKDINSGRTMNATAQIGYLSSQVISTGADIGAMIENNGEKMILIDEKGRFISEEMFLALTSLITFRTVKGATVVVPISAPSVIDSMADEYQGKVLRTKTSPLEVMGKMMANNVHDSLMNDQFILNFDALGSLIKIMDFMKSNNLKLSELVDQIPAFYITKKEVACPWNAKGKVIRQIIEESNDHKLELMEGVKIYKDGGWVLVLPDAERPVCKVIGEGYTEEFAESLTDIFVNRVQEIGQGAKRESSE